MNRIMDSVAYDFPHLHFCYFSVCLAVSSVYSKKEKGKKIAFTTRLTITNVSHSTRTIGFESVVAAPSAAPPREGWRSRPYALRCRLAERRLSTYGL